MFLLLDFYFFLKQNFGSKNYKKFLIIFSLLIRFKKTQNFDSNFRRKELNFNYDTTCESFQVLCIPRHFARNLYFIASTQSHVFKHIFKRRALCDKRNVNKWDEKHFSLLSALIEFEST